MQQKVLVSSKASVKMKQAPLIEIVLTPECGVDDLKLSDLSKHLREGNIVLRQETILSCGKKSVSILLLKKENENASIFAASHSK